MNTTVTKFEWGRRLPAGNYRSVSVREELVERVERLIRRVKTYHSVSEFVSEAVRLRVEAIERQEKLRGENEDEPEK
jgi:Arc/MetJ-type ribon-helix-helix transcriptional regulator